MRKLIALICIALAGYVLYDGLEDCDNVNIVLGITWMVATASEWIVNEINGAIKPKD